MKKKIKESERFDELVTRLIFLRKKHNWTQSDLSKKAGVPSQTINRIEMGGRIPALRTVVKLASAFNISLNELVYLPSTAVVTSSDLFYVTWFDITLLNKDDQLFLSKVIYRLLNGAN